MTKRGRWVLLGAPALLLSVLASAAAWQYYYHYAPKRPMEARMRLAGIENGMRLHGPTGLVLQSLDGADTTPTKVEYRVAGRLVATDGSPAAFIPNSVAIVDPRQEGMPRGDAAIEVVVHVAGKGRKSLTASAVFDPSPALNQPRTVLLFAPHPDDAVLGLGALLKAGIDRGDRASVAVMTNNDFFAAGFRNWVRKKHCFDVDGDRDVDYVDYGYWNMSESYSALGFLGIPRDRVFHLGYPEGALSAIWEDPSGASHASPLAPSITSSPYGLPGLSDFHRERTGRPAAFTRESLRDDLLAVIEKVRPDEIILVHPDDTHPAHHTTSIAVLECIRALHLQVPFRFYLIHWGGLAEYPGPGDAPAAPTRDGTPALPVPHRFPLDPDLLRMKQAALSVYESQFVISREISGYLRAFVKPEEVYWTARLLYAGEPLETQVPADGTLFLLHFDEPSTASLEVEIVESPGGVSLFALKAEPHPTADPLTAAARKALTFPTAASFDATAEPGPDGRTRLVLAADPGWYGVLAQTSPAGGNCDARFALETAPR